jgi:hypothetical protein
MVVDLRANAPRLMASGPVAMTDGPLRHRHARIRQRVRGPMTGSGRRLLRLGHPRVGARQGRANRRAGCSPERVDPA